MPRLVHDEEDPDPLVALVGNGDLLGVCESSKLEAALAATAGCFGSAEVIVHSLLGHSAAQVLCWADSLGTSHCWYWLHDFFTLCPSFTLQRNDVEFCGAPSPESNACTICRYGEERPRHLEEMCRLFASIEVSVISPSEVAAGLLRKRWRGNVKIFVQPHVTLDWAENKEDADSRDANDAKPVSVAFLGTPAQHKGWDVFLQLARKYEADERYRFVAMGMTKPPARGIEWRSVHATAQNRLAMTQAVADEAVDFVLHWASWYETFSFTTFEAMAGGALVLTHPETGNVAAAVTRERRGLVLTDETALHHFFESGQAVKTAEEARKQRKRQRCESHFSAMAFSVIDTERCPQ